MTSKFIKKFGIVYTFCRGNLATVRRELHQTVLAKRTWDISDKTPKD